MCSFSVRLSFLYGTWRSISIAAELIVFTDRTGWIKRVSVNATSSAELRSYVFLHGRPFPSSFCRCRGQSYDFFRRVPSLFCRDACAEPSCICLLHYTPDRVCLLPPPRTLKKLHVLSLIVPESSLAEAKKKKTSSTVPFDTASIYAVCLCAVESVFFVRFTRITFEPKSTPHSFLLVLRGARSGRRAAASDTSRR